MAARNQELWRKRVAEWMQSGQTARAFAAQAGLNPGTLAYWKWRLSREAAESAPRTGRRTDAIVELSTVAFVDERVEVELVSGHKLRVPAGFDAASLIRLVAVLGGRP